MKLGIKPVGYRLLLKPDDIEETSKGGIYLNVDGKLERAAQTVGTLVAIGDMAWKDMMQGNPWANIGDRVMYARYAGKNVTDPLTGKDYIIINDKDLTAIITEPLEDNSNE